ncbi:protein-export chaperone SecB [Oecophyllibacter saccharovorans]|uniref:Protein-export protein SecB n=1 Tax=Oecophyllibacter saccharovorans TaxID=2558360 RepID=A0A506UQ93_9PROT|nr:protein-export chaperone SecB [Oecophyllibacter saccharovorans]QDH15707.1 protein-export chaperone SecB [Oecophyllibacter saccharovorans]TPW35486.1 protein-export chaperone SecB [Oecophyllibacter saccharovorans]TPW36727.1 protein-export chaperone SecB [Oecophyllibacter saccharovorans]
MADTDQTPPAQPTDAQNAPEQNAPPGMPVAINLQYLRDLSFEVPQGANTFATLRTPPQVGVNIDVQANRLQQDQQVYEVALIIRAEAVEAPTEEKPEPGRVVFIAELNYAAIVTLDNPPAEAVEPILLVEVPRLLFPYARSIISDVTREGGFPPIVLQPIDFVAMWQAKRAQNFPEPAGEA